jgi:hypothetical protein
MTYGAEAAGSGFEIEDAVIAAADVCLFFQGEVYNVGLWFLQ